MRMSERGTCGCELRHRLAGPVVLTGTDTLIVKTWAHGSHGSCGCNDVIVIGNGDAWWRPSPQPLGQRRDWQLTDDQG